MDTQQKNFKVRVLIIIVAIAVVSATIGFIAFSNSPAQRLKRQLDLGQKYLNELDYEKAVVAFTKALDIDSQNENTKSQLETAYAEWISTLVAEGKNDEAFSVLNEALGIMPDSSVFSKLQETIPDLNENSESDLTDADSSTKETEQSEIVVDIDFDADSYSINNMAIKSIDYEKMLESLGGNETPYAYYHPIGSTDNVAIDAISASGEVIHLNGNDGFFHDSNDNIVEPERKYLTVYHGNGVTCEYTYYCSRSTSTFSIITYHENSPSQASTDYISTFSNLPFIYGTYEEMNEVFHTDEIISSTDYEDAGNGYRQYIFGGGSLLYYKGDDHSSYEYTLDGLTVSIRFEGAQKSSEVTYKWHN